MHTQLSLKSILLLTVGTLTLLIAIFSFRDTYYEIKNMLRINQLQEATLVNDKLFETTEKFSVLRNLTTSILYAKNKATTDLLMPELLKARADADSSIIDSIESIKIYNFPDLENELQKLELEFEELKQFRIIIAEYATMPSTQRDEKILKEWFEKITSIIMHTQDLWMHYIKHFSDIDSAVTLHMRFKHFLGVITEYTGRERALIGQLIVTDSSPSPSDQANLLRWHGAIEISWDRLYTLVTQANLDSSLNAYLQDAKSHYITVYEMVRDMFYIPGKQYTGNYPINVELWLELSSQSTDSLYDLKNAAMVETQKYVSILGQKAKQAIIINIAIVILTISLCLYTFWIISFRVINPITYIVNALLDTSHGKKVSLSKDIAKRHDEIGKLAQVLTALQLSRERYRAIVEASSQIIWTWEPEDKGGMEAFKAWWENTTGQPGSEILPFGWLKVVHPEDRKRAESAWIESSQKGEVFDIEYRIRAKNGKYRFVSSRGVPIKNDDGSLREITGALNDITLRKTAEIAINQSQAKLRAVVDNALDGLISINALGNIESFNPACERIFGYMSEEVIGHNIKMLMPEPYHSEHDKYLFNYTTTGVAKIIGTAGREVKAKRKDGTVFPIDLSICSYSLEDGKHFSGILRDITLRKSAEAQLHLYMQNLERSNKELDDFAYIASHDLKEPLRGIHNHSRFLLEDNSTKLDSDSVDRLNRLVYLSQRMERLVNDLLYFSRLGRQDLAVQPADLNEMIHDIENTIDLFVEDHNATIKIPTPLPTITCDITRVTEVFRNLITNAIKYNDKETKAVEIGCIDNYTHNDGTKINRVFYVKDDGNGIPSEFHTEIFRIFRRLQTNKSKQEGTGVGLTFVKKIIERHGGKIWLESEITKGTTFYFTLEDPNARKNNT